MNKFTTVFIILTIFSLVFIITGCKEETGMSIDERIKAFVSELNDSNRDGLKEHLHNDCPIVNTANEGHWNSFFDTSSGSFSLGSISDAGSSKRNVIINSTDGSTTGDNYQFTMKEEDEDDWYILSIIETVSSTNLTQ